MLPAATLFPMKKKPPPPETLRRLSALEETLRTYGSVLLAYSGGVDSTFLLAVAVRVLGDRCGAVTVGTIFHEQDEVEDAVRRAAELGARHEVLNMDLEECGDEALANPPDRCYHCKKLIFRALLDRAAKEELSSVIEASHSDDLRQRRPGVKALRELEIRSPLLEAGLTKEQIRELQETARKANREMLFLDVADVSRISARDDGGLRVFRYDADGTTKETGFDVETGLLATIGSGDSRRRLSGWDWVESVQIPFLLEDEYGANEFVKITLKSARVSESLSQWCNQAFASRPINSK